MLVCDCLMDQHALIVCCHAIDEQVGEEVIWGQCATCTTQDTRPAQHLWRPRATIHVLTSRRCAQGRSPWPDANSVPACALLDARLGSCMHPFGSLACAAVPAVTGLVACTWHRYVTLRVFKLLPF